ncbi:IPT/TIG domain-containing protein [Streptomyces sp. NPDC000880]
MHTAASSPPNPTRRSAVLAAPTIALISPSTGFAGTTVTVNGSGFTGVTAVTFGGVPATSYTVVSATRITAVAPAGAGTVQIVVTAAGGTSNGVNFTYRVATPVISALVPDQGPVVGGNTVTLTGSWLDGASQVRFGAAAASFTVVSASQVTAVAPAGAAGTVSVTITTPGGTSAGVPYTYILAPDLTAVTPDQGPLAGGDTVTLTGTGLTGASQVRFGTVSAPFTVVSPTEISATVPPATAGGVPVTVTTPGGTSTVDVYYHYLGVPLITAITPGSGPTAGANAVILTGSRLVAATAVDFGGATATAFTVVSDLEISAVVPAGTAGTVAVTVTSPGGTSDPGWYSYLNAPTLSAVAPNQGPLGGNTVTLTGTGLAETAEVRFGTLTAAFGVVSDTMVTAVVPPGLPGTVNITVVTPGGSSAGVGYTRLLPPGI